MAKNITFSDAELGGLLAPAGDGALGEALATVGGKLIKHEGMVAVSFSGEVASPDGRAVRYALIPREGTLAKAEKWQKLLPAERVALVEQRANAATAAAFNEEVARFVRRVAAMAAGAKLDPSGHWDGLVFERETAGRRFEVVEGRVVEAVARQHAVVQAERSRKTVQLARYPESFELASQLPRRFIAVLGPTNSGKTHVAMEHLAQARSGVYLAPLRLLALENYERLADAGVPVSLITGEERRLTPGATHVASTVEMLDIHRAVDVAVIDEIQMLEDPARGAAWTAAVCGVPADTVYLLGSVSARGAIEALVRRLGCSLEVRTLERKNPLAMDAKHLGNLQDLRKGDAVIAFSRKDVLYWAEQVTRSGFSVAAIYGNLSPEVRRAQAARFRDGEADVVVATDAIGMGLNLPIARVIFTTARKFDGYDEDVLSVPLALQIAGRAGRYGMHEAGLVAGLDQVTHRGIATLMSQRPDDLPVKGFFVAPSLDQLERIAAATGETKLFRLLTLFSKHVDLFDEFFLPANLDDQLERAQWLDAQPLTLEHRFLFSLVPVSTRVASANAAWEGWAKAVARNKASRLELVQYMRSAQPLQAAEDACKVYSAYAWLAYRLPELFPDGEAAVVAARAMSAAIDKMLQAQHAAKGRVETKRKKGRSRGR